MLFFRKRNRISYLCSWHSSKSWIHVELHFNRCVEEGTNFHLGNTYCVKRKKCFSLLNQHLASQQGINQGRFLLIARCPTTSYTKFVKNCANSRRLAETEPRRSESIARTGFPFAFGSEPKECKLTNEGLRSICVETAVAAGSPPSGPPGFALG